MIEQILTSLFDSVIKKSRITKTIADKTDGAENSILKARTTIRKQLARDFIAQTQNEIIKSSEDCRVKFGLGRDDNEMYVIIKVSTLVEILTNNLYKFIRFYSYALDELKKKSLK